MRKKISIPWKEWKVTKNSCLLRKFLEGRIMKFAWKIAEDREIILFNKVHVINKIIVLFLLN